MSVKFEDLKVGSSYKILKKIDLEDDIKDKVIGNIFKITSIQVDDNIFSADLEEKVLDWYDNYITKEELDIGDVIIELVK